MGPSHDHPYRPLYVPATRNPPPAEEAGGRRELLSAFGILIAISAIQVASGAQVMAGVLGLAGGFAGFFSTWRRSWTTPSSFS